MVVPSANVTDAGIVAELGRFVSRPTTRPPTGAGDVSLIVAVDDVPAETVSGEAKIVSIIFAGAGDPGGSNVRFADTDTPAPDAVTVTVVVDETTGTVRPTLTRSFPAASVTVAGSCERMAGFELARLWET